MLLRLAFCFTLLFGICYSMWTWLGAILQMGSEMGFQTYFGFGIHQVRHAPFCGSIAQTAFVCCLVSFVALGAQSHPGVVL